MWATLERDGIVQMVTREQFEDMLKTMKRRELIKAVMMFAEQVAVLKADGESA